MRKEHTESEASYGRNAFAKAIYERLFGWIVKRINAAIAVDNQNIQKIYQSSLIGVNILLLKNWISSNINDIFYSKNRSWISMVLKYSTTTASNSSASTIVTRSFSNCLLSWYSSRSRKNTTGKASSGPTLNTSIIRLYVIWWKLPIKASLYKLCQHIQSQSFHFRCDGHHG